MEFPVWIIPTSTFSLLSSFNCFAISAFLSFFNLFEKENLNSIVSKIEKAVVIDNPKFIYRAPLLQVIGAKLYQLFKM